MRIETKKLNDLIIPQWYAKTDSAAEMARHTRKRAATLIA